MPRSGIGLAAIGGLAGALVVSLGVLLVKTLIEEELWQFAVAGGVSVFVALIAIDWLSEWATRRQKQS